MTPKTIADLKINLKFSKELNYCPTFSDFEAKFQEENPNLPNYKIKAGIYRFRIWIPTCEKMFIGTETKYESHDWINFTIEIMNGIYLVNFLYLINYNIYSRIRKDTCFCTELDNFVREYDDYHYLINTGLPF